MSNNVIEIVTIAHVIQTAVAPVFLLSGVAALLGVLSTRLGRVIDRARILEAKIHSLSPEQPQRKVQTKELKFLWKRARLINRAFSLGTVCALMVCFVVVMLFYSHIASMNMAKPISLTFMTAMLFLIGTLLLTLREIYLATGSLHRGMEVADIKIISEEGAIN
jgi:hypothetical protein